MLKERKIEFIITIRIIPFKSYSWGDMYWSPAVLSIFFMYNFTCCPWIGWFFSRRAKVRMIGSEKVRDDVNWVAHLSELALCLSNKRLQKEFFAYHSTSRSDSRKRRGIARDNQINFQILQKYCSKMHSDVTCRLSAAVLPINVTAAERSAAVLLLLLSFLWFFRLSLAVLL